MQTYVFAHPLSANTIDIFRSSLMNREKKVKGVPRFQAWQWQNAACYAVFLIVWLLSANCLLSYILRQWKELDTPAPESPVKSEPSPYESCL